MKIRVSIFFTLYGKPSWPKDSNVTLMSFLRLFTETVTPERKGISSGFHGKYCQIGEIHEKLSTSYFAQNWNFSFRNYLLKYEPRIKDLISLMILILFGLQIKAGKIKLKKNKLNF